MDDNKKKALAAALGQIEKQFGKGSIMKLGDNRTMDVETVSTGSLSLDIALGAGQWVDHYHYTDLLYPTSTCIKTLKDKGYKIAATTPHTDAYTINDVPIDEPIAFRLGSICRRPKLG